MILSSFSFLTFPMIDPIALQLGPLSIRWYSLAYITGFLGALFYIRLLLPRTENHTISFKNLDDLLIFAVMGVILGGRLGYVLFYNFSYYLENLKDIFAVWKGGMSFHGGLIGLTIAIIIYAIRKKLPLLKLGDLIVCAAPIGLFFGRIANFINGELYGRVTTAPWGMIFPHAGDLPRHPSQLYEAFLEGLLLFTVLHLLWRIQWIRLRSGFLSGMFFIGYGIARFIIEFFRLPDTQVGYLWHQLTMGQILSLPMILFGIGLIIWSLHHHKKVKPLFITDPLLNNEKEHLFHAFFTKPAVLSAVISEKLLCPKYQTAPLKDFLNHADFSSLDEEKNLSHPLVMMQQKHTHQIEKISAPLTEDQWPKETDGMITQQKNIALGVYTADCLPILLYDPKEKVIASVHAGWKGADKEIARKAIEKMKELKSDPANIIAVIGPAISQKSYEVDQEFYDHFNAPKYFKLKNKRTKKYQFDLKKYVFEQLKSVGVKHVRILAYDTYKKEKMFYSYRLATHQKINIQNWHQLSCIMLKRKK